MNFKWPLRVYYEDTDSGGVVYYANYLKFMERARTEFLRSLGFEQDQLIEQKNIIFAVRSLQLDYLSPARFNDKLIITAQLIELKKASMLFKQTIYREQQAEKILCQGEVRIACINAASFRPAAIPESIVQLAKETLGVD